MCVCCCTNECTKWLLECITSSSSAYPSSGQSEELLFGDQLFPGNDGTNNGNDKVNNEEHLERERVKREHCLRSTSLLNATNIISTSDNILNQVSTHTRKQLFNGHGYNLAIYKGHVRGKLFHENVKLASIITYGLMNKSF